MKGRSHIATNLFSAIAVNSTFHLVDNVYSWHQILLLVTGPQLAAALQSQQLWHKLLFFAMVIGSARLPDLDQRKWLSRMVGGHRGCTHSLLSILFIVMFGLALTVGLPALLAAHSFVLRRDFLGFLTVGVKGFVVGWTLHLAADSLTKMGIPLFWPIPTRIGLFPIAALRFRVGTVWEDMVLWGIIFLIGFGVGTGAFGL